MVRVTGHVLFKSPLSWSSCGHQQTMEPWVSCECPEGSVQGGDAVSGFLVTRSWLTLRVPALEMGHLLQVRREAFAGVSLEVLSLGWCR